MTTTIKFNFNEYVRISSQNVGYNPEAKEQFLKMSKKLAAITAQELGLEKASPYLGRSRSTATIFTSSLARVQCPETADSCAAAARAARIIRAEAINGTSSRISVTSASS
jgi:glycine/D-amino acid oxidase-like deaminating enzyme